MIGNRQNIKIFHHYHPNSARSGRSVVAVDARQAQMMGHSPFEDASRHVQAGQTKVV
jgi:hypothetical protein